MKTKLILWLFILYKILVSTELEVTNNRILTTDQKGTISMNKGYFVLSQQRFKSTVLTIRITFFSIKKLYMFIRQYICVFIYCQNTKQLFTQVA